MKHRLKRFYKCSCNDCGRLIEDMFRDEDKMDVGVDIQEKQFDDLEKHFHCLEFAFVYDKGPNKKNCQGLFKLREKAIASGILPKDYYAKEYGNNHVLTSAVRAVADSLAKWDRTKFRWSFQALMYVIFMGNYHKLDK